MADEASDREEIEDAGPSPAEVSAALSQFEARIEAGELPHGSFHRAVQSELYPLIASGHVEETALTRLVAKWAEKNHPFDWHARSYLDEGEVSH